jgi:hypothetical protein
MTTGKSIALGVGVGISAYMALVASLALFGVKLGELGKFPADVGCLAKLEVTQAEAQEPCRQLRTYFQAEDGNPWRVEQLAAKAVATFDRLTAAARSDRDEILEAWVAPILRRLELAADVAKDIFLH